MSEKLNQKHNILGDKGDSMVCELGVRMVEKLRYTRFISTKELEKLHTCHNLEELDKYFQIEQQILDYIFKEDSRNQKKRSFQKEVLISEENIDVLYLIQSYVSIDYIRSHARDFDDKNIKSLKLTIKKDTKNRFYISNIQMINK